MGQSQLARPVTVALVDDHEVVLDGVRSWIDRDEERRLALIAGGRWVDSVLAGPGRHADVLVLDLALHGECITNRVIELAQRRRVLVFSAETSDEIIRAMLDAGVGAYLTKQEGRKHFINAVLAVAADRPYVTQSLAKAMLGSIPARPRLSPQEERALRLWFQLPKKQNVAREMGIATDTVDQYISRARVKYAAVGRPAPNKAAMVARAIEDGLVRPEDVC